MPVVSCTRSQGVHYLDHLHPPCLPITKPASLTKSRPAGRMNRVIPTTTASARAEVTATTIATTMVAITIRILMGRSTTIAGMAMPATRPRRARFLNKPARSEASEVPQHTIFSPSKVVLAPIEQKRGED